MNDEESKDLASTKEEARSETKSDTNIDLSAVPPRDTPATLPAYDVAARLLEKALKTPQDEMFSAKTVRPGPVTEDDLEPDAHSSEEADSDSKGVSKEESSEAEATGRSTDVAAATEPEEEGGAAEAPEAESSPAEAPSPEPAAAQATPTPGAARAAVPQGPRGTAVMGVSRPGAPVAQGPRGTAVMGVSRPVVPKRGDAPDTSSAEQTASHSFSKLAVSERHRRVQAALGVAIGVLLAVGLVVLVIVVSSDDKPEAAASASPEVTATAHPQQAQPGPEPSPAAVTASASAAPTGADAEAIAALTEMRELVGGCMKKLKQMPGTSHAVPATLKMLSEGSYKPLPRDFNAPFYNCTTFKLDSPMRFVIQWQFHAADRMGMGIAWIDEDKDGKADRAYGFTAKATTKDAAEFSAVGPLDPATRIEKPIGR
ncbi:MAG: hypothetical protein HOW73_31815 [Polyangiaceae bacterium]|nr:hypothetical protein [Polyangiaceae bacterium]